MDYQQIIQTFADKYQIMKLIGKGEFGKIYRVSKQDTNEIFVIKQINLGQMNEIYQSYMRNELELLTKCKNQNLVDFIESCENNDYLYIVMENCALDLEKLHEKYFKKNIPEKYAVFILKQLVNGFAYLHENNIMHRDIKLENILVNATEQQLEQLEKRQFDTIYEMKFKIGDFGLSKQMNQKNDLTETFAGSPLTMAPEILEEQPYGNKVDMYSLGVIMYQMIYGNFPYDNSEQMGVQQEDLIKRQDAKFSYENVQVSKDLENLIRQMLKYDPQERLDWIQLHESQFIKLNNNRNIQTIDFINNISRLRIYQKSTTIKQKLLQIQSNIYLICSDDEFEIISYQDPTAEFINRILIEKNKYIMLHKAINKLKQLEPSTIQQIQNNINWLESLALQLYCKLATQIKNNQNILMIDQKQWQDLLKSEEYLYLQQLIAEDAQQFNVESEENRNQEQKSWFGKNKQNNKLISQQKDFDQNYSEIIEKIIKYILNLRKGQTQQQDTQIQLIYKQCLAHLLYIYKAFEKSSQYSLIDQFDFDSNDDEEIDKIQLELLNRQDSKIKKLFK